MVGVMDSPFDKQKCDCHLCGYSKPIEIQIVIHNFCVFLLLNILLFFTLQSYLIRRA